jgi:hypothetical protein
MFILLTVRHIAVNGEALRHVTCERCKHDFDYRLERSVTLDTLPLPALVRRAERTCRERLARRLSTDVEPVPCPSCGWVQAEMVRELRRRFGGCLKAAGVALTIASAALSSLFVAFGIWFRYHPRPLDLDFFGVAGAGAAGCAAGLMLILSCEVTGRLRHREVSVGRGFPVLKRCA